MHAASVLEDAGFSTLEASTTDDAIRLLETRREITIVLSDIDLPGSMTAFN